MAVAHVRWIQRLKNYERALTTLERALTLLPAALSVSSNNKN